MKHLHLYALIALTTLISSCGAQSKEGQKTGATTNTIDTLQRAEELSGPSSYEYTDPEGKRVVVQNHLPRGGVRYTGPDGQSYGLVVFWSQFTNETNQPLEVEISIPDTVFDFPHPEPRYLKLLVPGDTMTKEKTSLINYGIGQLEAFMNSNFYKPSFLKRTIGPNSSSGFHVVLLTKTDSTVKSYGTLRTGFSLKGQDLYYRVSNYMPAPPNIPKTGEKEYLFGRINLKNLKPVN